MIAGLKGHYKVHPFEELEEQIDQYDDVTMWTHANSRVLHDPSGWYGRVQGRCSAYPGDVWRVKIGTHAIL